MVSSFGLLANEQKHFWYNTLFNINNNKVLRRYHQPWQKFCVILEVKSTHTYIYIYLHVYAHKKKQRKDWVRNNWMFPVENFQSSSLWRHGIIDYTLLCLSISLLKPLYLVCIEEKKNFEHHKFFKSIEWNFY